MKIRIATFLLASIFLSAVPAFADGIIPTGGRPANQTTVETTVKTVQNSETDEAVQTFSFWTVLSYLGF